MVNTHSWVMGTFIYWLQKLFNIRHQEMQVAIRNVNMVIKLIFKKFLTQFSFFNFLMTELTDFYILIILSAKLTLATIEMVLIY